MNNKKVALFVLFCFMFFCTTECFSRDFILSKHSTFSTFDVKDYSPSGKMYIKVFKDGLDNSNVENSEFKIKAFGTSAISGNLEWDETLESFIGVAELNSFKNGDVLNVFLSFLLTSETDDESGMSNEPVIVFFSTSVEIGEEAPVADAGIDQLNMGYGTTINLDGRLSTGKNLSYKWEISEANDESIVTLIDNGDGTASFTLPNFDAIVKAEPYQPVYDNAKVFPMTYDMMGAYELSLTVTDDNGESSTDYVEVTSTSRSSGLKNVPLGKPIYFVAPEMESYKWILSSKPEDSASKIDEGDSRIANITPDVIGKYTIEEENSTSSISINVSTFVGVGTVGDNVRPKLPNCSVCHRFIHRSWKGTHHSIALTNKYNGFLTDGETPFPFFREFCVKCHTTGLDKAETTKNDGFDDEALKEGWTYPLPDQFGNVNPENFSILLEEFPNTAQKAQVQCEMCHGPGSKPHVFDKTNIDRTLQPTVCGQCHAFEPFHNRYVEWLSSAHARSVRMGFPALTGVPAGVNPDNPLNGCGVHCHTVEGFLKFRVFDSVPSPEMYQGRRNDVAPVSCILCHNPMSNFGNVDEQGLPIEDGRKQIRFYGETTIPKWNQDETEVINVEVDAGPAAICTKCHLHNMYLKNEAGELIDEPKPFKAGEGIPRHQQAQVYFGIGASEYDPDEFGLGPYPEPTHVKAFRETFDNPKYCVHCHMLRYDVTDEQFGKLGSHTWEMEYEVENDETGETTLFQNGKPCFDCHLDAKDDNAPGGYSFAFGEEGEEYLRSLLEQLKNLLPQDEQGNVVWNPTGDDFGTPDDSSDDIPPLDQLKVKAAFNYYFIVNDGSQGRHNMAYAVRLIGDAIRSLDETPIERSQ